MATVVEPIKTGKFRKIHPLPEAPGMCLVKTARDTTEGFTNLFTLLKRGGVPTPYISQASKDGYTSFLYNTIPVFVALSSFEGSKRLHRPSVNFHLRTQANDRGQFCVKHRGDIILDNITSTPWVIDPKKQVSQLFKLKKTNAALKAEFRPATIAFPVLFGQKEKKLDAKVIDQMTKLAKQCFFLFEHAMSKVESEPRKMEVFFGVTLMGRVVVTGICLAEKNTMMENAWKYPHLSGIMLPDKPKQAIVCVGDISEENCALKGKQFPGAKIIKIQVSALEKVRGIKSPYPYGGVVILGPKTQEQLTAQVISATAWPVIALAKTGEHNSDCIRVAPKDLVDTVNRILMPNNSALYAFYHRNR